MLSKEEDMRSFSIKHSLYRLESIFQFIKS